MTTGRIATAHGWFSGIRRWSQCAPPHNTCFIGPTRAQIPNGISIGLAVFAGLAIVTDRPADRPRYSVCNNDRRKMEDINSDARTWVCTCISSIPSDCAYDCTSDGRRAFSVTLDTRSRSSDKGDISGDSLLPFPTYCQWPVRTLLYCRRTLTTRMWANA